MIYFIYHKCSKHVIFAMLENDTSGIWQECGPTSHVHLYLMLSIFLHLLISLRWLATLPGWNHEAGHLHNTLVSSEKALPGHKGLQHLPKSMQKSHIWSVPRHQIHQQVLAQDSSAMQASVCVCVGGFCPGGPKSRQRAVGQALVPVLGWRQATAPFSHGH